MSRKRIRVTVAAVALAVGAASGQIITPVAGDPSLGNGSTLLSQTYDASGLIGAPGPGAIHSATQPTNSYIQSGSTLTVTYDLGAVTGLDGCLLWNQNAGGPGSSGTAGVRDVDFYASLDGSNFFPIGSFTFAQELLSTSSAQTADFGYVDARYIRLYALSNHGYSITGLAEIRFLAAEDCNGNGVSDDTDISTGTSTDFNANGVPDDCLSEDFVYNATRGVFYTHLSEALYDPIFLAGDTIYMSGGAVNRSHFIPHNIVAWQIVGPRALSTIEIGNAGVLTLFDGSVFDSDGVITAAGGTIFADTNATVTITDPIQLIDAGFYIGLTDSFTDAFHGMSVSYGSVILRGATFDGEITLGTGVTPGTTDSTLIGFGTLTRPISVMGTGQWRVQADFQAISPIEIFGGEILVQNGLLTAFQGITNNGGSIIGDIGLVRPIGEDRASSSDPGTAVFGAFAMSADAELRMPSANANLRVANDLDIAINDHTRFDMAQASIQLIGTGGPLQNIETLSADIGPDRAGLDRTIPGHFPIGTLRVGPIGTTANLVNNHDNALDGPGCEALYVTELIIDDGSSLLTNGCRIYYETLTLDGYVDDPDNLIQFPTPCSIADLDADGDIDVFDLILFLQNFEPTATCPGDAACAVSDLDNDDDIDVFDLILFLQNFDPDDLNCQSGS